MNKTQLENPLAQEPVTELTYHIFFLYFKFPVYILI